MPNGEIFLRVTAVSGATIFCLRAVCASVGVCVRLFAGPWMWDVDIRSALNRQTELN